MSNYTDDATMSIEFVRIAQSLLDVATTAGEVVANWRAENLEEIEALAEVTGAIVHDLSFDDRTREMLLSTDAGDLVLGVDSMTAATVMRMFMVAMAPTMDDPFGGEGIMTLQVLGVSDGQAVVQIEANEIVVAFSADPLGFRLY